MKDVSLATNYHKPNIKVIECGGLFFFKFVGAAITKESLPRTESARLKRGTITAALEEGIDFSYDTNDESRHTLLIPDEDGTVTKMVKDETFWNDLERWQIPIGLGFSQRVYTNFVPKGPKGKNLQEFTKVSLFKCNPDINITGLITHKISSDQIDKLNHHKNELKAITSTTLGVQTFIKKMRRNIQEASEVQLDEDIRNSLLDDLEALKLISEQMDFPMRSALKRAARTMVATRKAAVKTAGTKVQAVNTLVHEEPIGGRIFSIAAQKRCRDTIGDATKNDGTDLKRIKNYKGQSWSYTSIRGTNKSQFFRGKPQTTSNNQTTFDNADQNSSTFRGQNRGYRKFRKFRATRNRGNRGSGANSTPINKT